MATNKVWLVKHIPGNWRTIEGRTCANGPYSRADALANAGRIYGGWRVWVQHISTGERIFESQGMKEFRAECPDVIL